MKKFKTVGMGDEGLYSATSVEKYAGYLAGTYTNEFNDTVEDMFKWFSTGGLSSSLNFETAILTAEEVLNEPNEALREAFIDVRSQRAN